MFRNAESALRALILEADRAMGRELTPVTVKTILAVSGDPHDYVSMGPYWWPDPEKTDGLPYIRRDGERNPETARLDRSKIDQLLKTVRPLALGWYFTGDARYAQKAAGHLRMWFLDPETRMNPNFNYAQMIPGHFDGQGRAAGVIDGYSFVEIIEHIRLMQPSGALTHEDMQGLKQWFSEMTDWLLSSEIGIAERNATNNHGIAYDVQVVAYSQFAGREDVARAVVERFPHGRIFAQIEPDGSQPRELERTTAFHYSLYNLDHMMDMCLLAERQGANLYPVESEDGRSIAKAIAYMVPYLGIDQAKFPYQQINNWDGNQQKLAWTLRRSTFFAPDAGYEKLFEKYVDAPAEDLQWLLLGKSK